MTEINDESIRKVLKDNIAPVQVELRRDLWPQLLARMQERATSVPWFDWALLAALAIWLCLSPGTVPVLFYHL